MDKRPTASIGKYTKTIPIETQGREVVGSWSLSISEILLQGFSRNRNRVWCAAQPMGETGERVFFHVQGYLRKQYREYVTKEDPRRDGAGAQMGVLSLCTTETPGQTDCTVGQLASSMILASLY